MRTLVAYGSKYGCTKKCAGMLAERLQGEVTLVDLRETVSLPLEDFDCVVIGGSIYAGKIRGEVTRFCQENVDTLLQKKLGLFICCANIELAEEQIRTAFDERLRKHASARECFGYELKLEKMDFFSKMIIRAVKKTTKSESNILVANIEKMAAALN